MERYLSPAQVAEQLAICKRKAYDIIYSVPHISSPVRISERALKDWIDRNTVYPMQKSMKNRKTA